MRILMSGLRKVIAFSISICLFSTPVYALSDTLKENDDYSATFGSKISDELLAEIEQNTSEKIPVYIWYEDVDKTNLEEEITEISHIDIDDLEVDYSSLSYDLLLDFENVDEYIEKSDNDALENFKTKMYVHMQETASQRETEYKKTETYLSTKRSIVSRIYKERGKQVLTELNIEDNYYISEYAPVIMAELEAEDIVNFSENKLVKNIALYDCIESNICSIGPNDNFKGTMEISKINQYLSLTGEGIKVGIFDHYNLEIRDCLTNNLDYNKVLNVGNNYYGGDHGAYCASIVAGDYGVAPDAMIYAASSYPYDSTIYGNNHFDTMYNLESLISTNVDLISMSLGYSRSGFQTCLYSEFEKYVDFITQTSNTIFVIASGNDANSTITSPGLSYNSITVNGFHEANQNKVIDNYSFLDKHNNVNGCKKPDVISDSLSNGTSTATPVVAGMIALMYEYKPSLKAKPELVKAIVMASCHEKIDESLSNGITNREGAGIPSLYNMISIVAQHSYGYGVLNNVDEYIHITQPAYESSNINLALSFLQDGDTSSADVDLYLYNNNGNPLANSTASKSSTELIYCPLSSSVNNYKLNIHNYNSNINNINYAYAWSTDSAKFRNVLCDEGVYCLRNKSNNKYMTCNNSTSQSSLADFANTLNQSWIFLYNSTGNFLVKSASGNKFGMKIGTTISGNYKHFSEGTENECSAIIVRKNSDGTVSFLQTYNNTSYALGIYSNYVAWSPYSASNTAQKWYMESQQWRRGDVNMDGYINQSDAEIIRNHVNHTNDLTINVNKFLADANLNRVIDVTDVSYINLNIC